MIFEKKFRAARKWLRRKNHTSEEQDTPLSEEELPTMEELRQEENKLELEKGDLPAMMLAGLLTILPVCLLVLLGMCLIAFLIFFI
ncbi:MAG: hypothetical protein J6J18_06215 [Oscillospiraceae bacterium]|nr:hypothetical protein [Oscillospiraceae bacterium]